jgi:hypothetical protein
MVAPLKKSLTVSGPDSIEPFAPERLRRWHLCLGSEGLWTGDAVDLIAIVAELGQLLLNSGNRRRSSRHPRSRTDAVINPSHSTRDRMGNPTNTGLHTNIRHRSKGYHTDGFRASNSRGRRHASRSDLRQSGYTRRNGRHGIPHHGTLRRETLLHHGLRRRGRMQLERSPAFRQGL